MVVRGGEFLSGFYYLESSNTSGKGANRCWLLVGGCETATWVGKRTEDACHRKVHPLTTLEDVCVVFVARISVDQSTQVPWKKYDKDHETMKLCSRI